MIQLFNMLDPFENHEGPILEKSSEGFSLLKHPWFIEDDEMVIWELKECWGSFSEIKTFIAIAKIAVCITTC